MQPIFVLHEYRTNGFPRLLLLQVEIPWVTRTKLEAIKTLLIFKASPRYISLFQKSLTTNN